VTSIQVAAALSRHPVAALAVGELVGSTLETIDSPIDLAVLGVTPDLAGAVEDIVRSIRRLLNPRVLIGATAPGVLGGGQRVDHGPAMMLWSASLGVDIEPIRLDAVGTTDATVIAGGAALASGPGTLVLLAEPASFPVTGLLGHLAHTTPAAAVIGGTVAPGALGAPGTLMLDDEAFRHGAVGAWLPARIPVRHAVGQGARPIGQPFAVTDADGSVLRGLGGRPALQRLNELVETLDDATRDRLAGGVFVGIAADEHRSDFGLGDFVVARVLGADRRSSSLALTAPVAVGTTVQFHVSDPATSIRHLGSAASGAAVGGLVFSDPARVTPPDRWDENDAAIIGQTGAQAGGLLCVDQIGPILGHNGLHAQAASVMLIG
jgi:small ligand-binding sensory domain FIST